MENAKLVKTYNYRLTLNEFNSIDENTRALIGVSCFAITELNVISKAYIHCAPTMVDDSPVKILNGIQRFVFLRQWSAKFYEYHQFVKEMVCSGLDEKELNRIKDVSLQCFERKKSLPGFPLFSAIRNETTNRYSQKSARKNLRHLSSHSELSLVLTDMDGNSFYPLGEEIVFSGRLNRFASNRRTREEKLQASQDWMNFNFAATRWARNVHTALLRRLLFPKFPGKKAHQKQLWLDEDHVSKFDEICLPIFMQKK